MYLRVAESIALQLIFLGMEQGAMVEKNESFMISEEIIVLLLMHLLKRS